MKAEYYCSCGATYGRDSAMLEKHGREVTCSECGATLLPFNRRSIAVLKLAFRESLEYAFEGPTAFPIYFTGFVIGTMLGMMFGVWWTGLSAALCLFLIIRGGAFLVQFHNVLHDWPTEWLARGTASLGREDA